MEIGNMNQMPPMSGQAYAPGPEKKSHGALVAVIIILLLIVIGGLYFLGQKMNGDYGVPATTDDQITASLEQQSNSDDLNSIEADLNATNVDSLDQGAAAIGSEL